MPSRSLTALNDIQPKHNLNLHLYFILPQLNRIRYTMEYNQSGPASVNGLNTRQIQSWMQFIALSLHPNPELVTSRKSSFSINEILSLFGIHSVIDVVAFLQSPSGLAVAALMKELEVEIANIQHLWLRQKQINIERHRHLVYLILGLKHDRLKTKKHVAKLTLLHIDKILHNKVKLGSFFAIKQNVSHGGQYMASHLDLSIRSIEQSLREKDFKLRELQEEAEAIKMHNHFFQKECEVQDKFLDNCKQLYRSVPFDVSFINEQLARLDGDYHKEQLNIDKLSFHLVNDSTHETQPESFDRMLTQMIENQARQLQMTILKHYQAMLASPSPKKIVEFDGKCYLIPAHHHLHELTPNERDKAHQDFLILKPQLNEAHKKIEESRRNEKHQLYKLNVGVIKNMAAVVDEMKAHQEQLASLQEASQSLKLELNANQQLTVATPRPTLTPSRVKSTNQMFKKNQMLSSDLKEQNQMRAGRPMPFAWLQMLLRYNPQFVAQEYNKRGSIKQQRPVTTAPTPLSLKPRAPFTVQ